MPASDQPDEDEFFDTLESPHTRGGDRAEAPAHPHPHPHVPDRATSPAATSPSIKEAAGAPTHHAPPPPPPPPSPPLQAPATSPPLRSRGSSHHHHSFLERRSSRLSLHEPVPAIPARFLDDAPACRFVASPLTHHSRHARPDDHSASHSPAPRPLVSVDRPPAHLTADASSTRSVSAALPRTHGLASPSPSRTASPAHDLALAALNGDGPRAMERVRNDDLFLDVAHDGDAADITTRLSSRTSWRDKRRSLPPDARSASAMQDRRPRTSGGPTAARPASRLGALQSELGRSIDRQRSFRLEGENASYNRDGHDRHHLRGNDQDDAVSVASYTPSRRNARYSSVALERPPMSPTGAADRARSPDASMFGRSRTSMGTITAKTGGQSQLTTKLQESEGDSPADSSEPKRSLPESVSADSQTAPSTVWDELDDLKSRIKKLELTGKLPSTSGAAIATSTAQPERPPTATTAPTTIDSSPKRERKQTGQSQAGTDGVHTSNVASPATADIHPLLHSALAKAKPLLNGVLYRSLEATAADALQLAAMTGSAGPQGTAFSTATGGTPSDRQVRRRADMMCRNLTDLCLALCDGKHDSPSLTASPITLELPSDGTPSGRFSRASRSRADFSDRAGGRPVSRLEARRSSILGLHSASSPPAATSPRPDADDLSASEQENTPSHTAAPEPRRFGRSSSRLSVPRLARYADEPTTSGDDDPTVRPASRAGSEFSFRSRAPLNTRGPAHVSEAPSRLPGLRASLSAARRETPVPDGHRELSRVASLTSDGSGRRRAYLRDSTPPVLEEEGSEHDYHGPMVSSQPRRRLISLGQFKFGGGGGGGTHRTADAAAVMRSSSLGQRGRQVLVE